MRRNKGLRCQTTDDNRLSLVLFLWINERPNAIKCKGENRIMQAENKIID